MLKSDYFKFLALFYVIMALVAACSDNEDKAPVDDILAEYEGQWQAVKVTKDDIEQEEYDDFVLVIRGDQVFQTYGNPMALFPIGNFEIITDTAPVTVSCHDIEVQFALSETNLLISFNLNSGNLNGRLNAIEGNYEFLLKRAE